MSAAPLQRVATLVRPMTTQVLSADVPALEENQVRVRLQGCGICASNVALWEGRPWFDYPRPAGAPGHEGWGTVDEVGASVTDLAPGERVALISGNAYAEYDVAPRQAVVRVPAEFDALPFPGEPLGCVMNIFERSCVGRGQMVAIVGVGFLGLLLTQLAANVGAHVVAISRRRYALQLAARAGAEHTLCSEGGGDVLDRAMRLTDARGYDRVIETGGLQSTLDLASAIAAEYGRLIIAGYHQDGLRQVNMQQWNWRALDVVNAHERSLERYVSGMQRAIAAILDGRMDPFPLFTHEVTLDSIDRGFELTRRRPDGFIKALLSVAQA